MSFSKSSSCLSVAWLVPFSYRHDYCLPSPPALRQTCFDSFDPPHRLPTPPTRPKCSYVLTSCGDAQCHVSGILISGRDGRLNVAATYRTAEAYPFPNPTPDPTWSAVPDLFDHQRHEVSRMCCCLSALGGALERIVPWVPSLPPWPTEMR